MYLFFIITDIFCRVQFAYFVNSINYTKTASVIPVNKQTACIINPFYRINRIQTTPITVEIDFFTSLI